MRGSSQPFASIIMPAHDVAPWVGRAIESCLAQSLRDWELIVVDDGSTDTTADIVTGFRDDRIELIRTSGGNGPGGARNRALDRASGRYLTPLDADDAFHPDRLNVLSHFADRQGVDTILFDRSIRSSQDPFLKPQPAGSPSHHQVPTTQFIVSSPPCKPLIPAALVSKTQARYPIGTIAAEDYAFIVLLLNGGGRLIQVDASLYWHRLRAGSLTRGSATAIHNAQLSVLNTLREQCTDPLVLEGLAGRQARIDHLHAVSEVVEDFRDRHIGRATRRLRQRPRLFIPTITRLLSILKYRMRRT